MVSGFSVTEKTGFFVEAYGDFSNSGVVMSNSSGLAELPILAGSGYTVPSGRKLDRHVHYRVLGKNIIHEIYFLPLL